MKFSCDKCGTRYQVSDDKVRGKTARLRCRKCRHLVKVDGTGLSDAETRQCPDPGSKARAEEGAAAAEPRPGSGFVSGRESPPAAGHAEGVGRGWHAVIGSDQVGPMDGGELEEAIGSGRITRRTYVWRADQGQWKPAEQVALIAGLFDSMQAVAAPLPPPAPPEAFEESEKRGNRGMAAVDEPASVSEPAPAEDRPRESPEEGGSEERPSGSFRQYVAPQDHQEDDAPEEELASLFEQASRDADESSLEEESPVLLQTSDPVVKGDLGSFFEGTEGDDDEEEEADPFAAALAKEAAAAAADDPFAQVSGPYDPDEPPRDTTQMFILASGVKNQRSPLRIAAFVAATVGLVAGLGLVINKVGGFQLGQVFQIGTERREAQPWEASGDVTELRDLLLGIRKAEEDSESRPRITKGGGAPLQETEAERRLREELEAERGAVDADRREMLSELYQQRDRGTITVRQRRESADQGPVSSIESPIDPELLQRRIVDAQPAFESCLQQELRRNPSFRAGRVELILTVMPSGVVRQARISDRNVDRSDLGRCISIAARRIMLPSFGGDEPVEFILPLVLTSTP